MSTPKPHNGGPPIQYRRKRRSNFPCTCDCNYAKSVQGICKVIQLFTLGLAWILIAASPYYRPIFVIGGEVWPFHIVMLLSVIAWVATLIIYCMFLSGYHLSMPHKNWPRIEFFCNVVIAIIVLFAACVEAAHVWRWDMSRGNVVSSGGGSSYYQYGLQPGMSFTQTLNFNSYCSRYPRDCSDYFSLLTGHNSYYTNHIFGVVMLFLSLVIYLVSIFFAYRTWRVFERDMYKPGKVPKPTLWMRMQYQMERAANSARSRFANIMSRSGDEEETDGGDVDIKSVPEKSNYATPKKDVYVVNSDIRSHRSTSKSEDRRSRSSRSEERHRSDHYNSEKSHRSSRDSELEVRSHRSGHSKGSSRHSATHKENGSTRNGSERTSERKKRDVADMSARNLSPVASVMI